MNHLEAAANEQAETALITISILIHSAMLVTKDSKSFLNLIKFSPERFGLLSKHTLFLSVRAEYENPKVICNALKIQISHNIL